MAQRKNVPASTIREWAKSPEGISALNAADAKFPGSRGRIDPTTKQVFHKENPRLVYTEKVAETPLLTVSGVVSIDSAGRKVTKTISVPNDQARTLLGHTFEKDGKTLMQRGRVPYGLLALALSALNADEVADQFATAV